MKVNGKKVLITGSTDGVGRYVAAKLASGGAKVLIHGRDTARAKTLADEIKRDGRGEAVFYQADLSSLAGARQLADYFAAIRELVANSALVEESAGQGEAFPVTTFEKRFLANGAPIYRLVLRKTV